MIVWLMVTAALLVAAVLSLFLGIEARDTSAADGDRSRRPLVKCGSVVSPAHFSEFE
ncbi:MAG: hypothetical protein ACRDP3_00520 [Streptomyces sp.]|uniref:hypothetical protein n=1 Tax=Streptomyces sp. TaxID=1931 RepID=UPI003D6AE5EA